MKFQRRWAAAALFVVASGISTLAHAAAVSGQGTWETTLQGRDLDGNLSTAEAYYDTVLNITWLADADAAVGSVYDSSGTGYMTWANAMAWAASLNINSVTGWRLPTVSPLNGSFFDYSMAFNNTRGSTDGSTDVGYYISAPGTVYAGSTAHEMSHLFYSTLGNPGFYTFAGAGAATGCDGPPDYTCMDNTGPFANTDNKNGHWSATEYDVAPDIQAWNFTFVFGQEGATGLKTNLGYAWAVHSGDVGVAVTTSTVPVPPAIWLFGSGLAGLFGFARKKISVIRKSER